MSIIQNRICTEIFQVEGGVNKSTIFTIYLWFFSNYYSAFRYQYWLMKVGRILLLFFLLFLFYFFPGFSWFLSINHSMHKAMTVSEQRKRISPRRGICAPLERGCKTFQVRSFMSPKKLFIPSESGFSLRAMVMELWSWRPYHCLICSSADISIYRNCFRNSCNFGIQSHFEISIRIERIIRFNMDEFAIQALMILT